MVRFPSAGPIPLPTLVRLFSTEHLRVCSCARHRPSVRATTEQVGKSVCAMRSSDKSVGCGKPVDVVGVFACTIRKVDFPNFITSEIKHLDVDSISKLED
jgi:hypothetical protein